MLRSIVCAGLAMIAVGLCASMPVVAAVPIDVGAVIQPLTAKEYPAPAIATVSEDVAVLPSEAPSIEADHGARSSTADSASSLASSTFNPPAYLHIDPDITG
ncbi:hypothetical protein [Xaviernesmea oryzae]|nr:hypothetical protein [Xaviernesmea oryzae]